MTKKEEEIPTKRKSKRELTAYHRAGHAVMAFHKGGLFTLIIIDQNNTNVMRHWTSEIWNLEFPPKKAKSENKRLTILAGIAAEDIFQGCRHRYSDVKNQEDIETFSKLWPAEEQKENNWQKLYLEAVDFLSQPTIWKQVEVVATTLLKTKMLAYLDVQLCIESIENKKQKKELESWLNRMKQREKTNRMKNRKVATSRDIRYDTHRDQIVHSARF